MSIYKSAFNISLFTIISRIFGFIRDIAIAYKLGTGFSSDIFFIALKIPNFFRRIFAEGAFSQAFIPIFSNTLSTQGEKQAFKFANQIFFYLLVSLFILIMIFEIAMPYVMAVFAPGYVGDPEKYKQVVFLARITFPYIMLISAVSMINGVLNSYKIFIPGSIMPIIYNSCLIISLFTLGDIIGDYGLSLSYGLIIGGIIQLLVIYIYAHYKSHNITPKRASKSSPLVNKFWHKLLPAIFASSIIQLNSWIDVIIASLIPNAVSYIYYSDRIIQLPLAIIGISLSVALLPTLSQMVKSKKDSNKANKLFNETISLSMFFTIPAMIGFFILNEEIIITLFARGEFNSQSASATSIMFRIYALAVPAFILIKILLTNFYARGNTVTPLKIAIVSLLINLCLNLLLIRFFSYLGIAVATVVSSWVNVLLLYVILRKAKYINITKEYIVKLIKICVNSLIIAIILLSIIKISPDYSQISSLYKISLLTFNIVLALVIYFIFNFLFKIYSLSEIKALLKK